MNTAILPKASPLQLAPVRSSQGGKTPIRVSYATLSLYAVDEDYFHNPQVIQIFFFLPNCIIFIPIPRDQNPSVPPRCFFTLKGLSC